MEFIVLPELVGWFLFFFFLINLFIYGCVGSLLLRRGLSLAAVSWGYSSLWCAGFSLRWLLLLWSTGSRAHGLQELWRTGLVAPRHVGSSQTRPGTHVSCIGRRILKHCATREVLVGWFLSSLQDNYQPLIFQIFPLLHSLSSPLLGL